MVGNQHFHWFGTGSIPGQEMKILKFAQQGKRKEKEYLKLKEKTSSQGRALDTFHSHPHHVLSFSSTTFFIVSWYRHVLNIFSVLYWLMYKSPCHFLYIWDCMLLSTGFPGGSVVKNTPSNAEDVGLVPGSGRYPGEGNGKPFQYVCLEGPGDRGAWWAAVHGVAKGSDMTKQQHTSFFTYFLFFVTHTL